MRLIVDTNLQYVFIICIVLLCGADDTRQTVAPPLMQPDLPNAKAR